MTYMVGFEAGHFSSKPISLEPNKTILDARNMMLRYNISRLVVAKGNEPLGILTEKDIARFVYAKVPSKHLEEVRVDEVMSKDLVTVDAELDLRKCAKLMIDRAISSLIVLKGKNMTGVITKTDLVFAYVHQYVGDYLIRDFMTKHVYTVSPDEPIHMAMLLMVRNRISRIVVTEQGRAVGIITTRDLLPASLLVDRRFLESLNSGKLAGKENNKQIFIPSGAKAFLVANDIMTKNPITIDTSSDVADAGYIMLRNRISGLPVVGQRQNLKGIITKTDIVKALASHA